MFATLGGSLPASTMPLTLPSPDLDAGSPSAAVEAVDGLVAAALADQVAAGLGVLTDGGLRHPDPIDALVRGLGGVERRAGAPPVARKLPRWERPIFVDGWAYAADRADRPVKQVLFGPYTLGRAIAPGRLGRPAVTLALAEGTRSSTPSPTPDVRSSRSWRTARCGSATIQRSDASSSTRSAAFSPAWPIRW